MTDTHGDVGNGRGLMADETRARLHPVTASAINGMNTSDLKVMAKFVPSAALALLNSGEDSSDLESVFDCRDMDPGVRQSIAEAMVRKEGPDFHKQAPLALLLSNELRLGRIYPSPSVWGYLTAFFQECSEYAPTERFYYRNGSLGDLASYGIAMVSRQLGLALAPEHVVDALCAKWPERRESLRAEAQKYPRLLTCETPWDSSEYTARMPDPDDSSPWLLPKNKRFVGAGVFDAEVLGRASDEDGSVWSPIHGLVDAGRFNPGSRLLAYAPRCLPPMPASLLDDVLAAMRRGRLMRDLQPLTYLLTPLVRTAPTSDIPRIARAILDAAIRFPRLSVRWIDLLYFLPLTPGTKDLWWEVALTSIQRSAHPAGILMVQEALAAHKMVGDDRDPSLYEPSQAQVEGGRGAVPAQCLFLLAPTMGVRPRVYLGPDVPTKPTPRGR